MEGRLAIRLFSRGILGSVFFVLGQQIDGKYLADYNADAPLDWKKPLHVVAKLLDNTTGKALHYAVLKSAKLVGKDDEAASELASKVVTFRPTRKYSRYQYADDKDKYSSSGKIIRKEGRSYGHESLVLRRFQHGKYRRLYRA